MWGVPQFLERLDHLGVEVALGHGRDAVGDQAQPLERVDGVTGALEGQVGVALRNQHDRLPNDGGLFLRQSHAAEAGAE